MDPESFFNWEANEDEMDYESFLSSNFDRSAITEAIIHPSMSQIQGNESSREISYDSFDDDTFMQSSETPNYSQPSNLGKTKLNPVKKEPTPGVMNFVTSFFSDYYSTPSPSFVSPSAVTPHRHGSPGFARSPPAKRQCHHPSRIPQRTNNNTCVYKEEKYKPPFSPVVMSQSTPNPALSLQAIGSATSDMSSSGIDISIIEQPPVEVRTRTPGENRFVYLVFHNNGIVYLFYEVILINLDIFFCIFE